MVRDPHIYADRGYWVPSTPPVDEDSGWVWYIFREKTVRSAILLGCWEPPDIRVRCMVGIGIFDPGGHPRVRILRLDGCIEYLLQYDFHSLARKHAPTGPPPGA